MKESCCQFGEHRQSAGIITEPESPPPGSRPLALVLVSAGLMPKSGPFRMYTELARRVAQDGLLTLRFDLGGIGDSQQEFMELPLKTRTDIEIRGAIDYLTEHHKPTGIVLGGLCSGAEDSFRYAELDPRVTGVLLIDPFSYKTWGWKWRNALKRSAKQLLRLIGVRREAEPEEGRPLVNYKYMESTESHRILKAVIKRRTRVHFVYTGGMSESFNHPNQLKSMFHEVDFEGCVGLDHFPRLGHTQLLHEDRQIMIEAIARRLKNIGSS